MNKKTKNLKAKKDTKCFVIVVIFVLNFTVYKL